MHLLRKNFKLLKSFGIVAEMNFSEHRCSVSCLLKELRESHMSVTPLDALAEPAEATSRLRNGG